MENKKDVEFNWEADASKGSVSEGFQKLLATGISAVMMSEESVKQYLQTIKIPKDTIGTVLKGVSKSKEEVVNRIGNEFSKIIEKIDVVEELTKFLRENKIHFKAEIEFSKKDKKEE